MKCSLVSLIAIDSDKIPKENINSIIEILNKLTDNDLVLFAGWTLATKLDLDEVIKENNNNLTTFVLEVGDGYRSDKEDDFGFYVVRGKEIIKSAIKQIFMDSSIMDFHEENEPIKNIKKLIDELNEKRCFNINDKNIRLIICGEHNILKSKKDKDYKAQFRFEEDTELNNQFQAIVQKTDIFLNPAHTRMGEEHILQKKLSYLSQNLKLCLFTANKYLTKDHQHYLFRNGEEEKGKINEVNKEYKITTIEIN